MLDMLVVPTTLRATEGASPLASQCWRKVGISAKIEQEI